MLHTCLNKQNRLFLSIVSRLVLKTIVITAALVSFNQSAIAWESEDGTLEARGFIENASYFRTLLFIALFVVPMTLFTN
jgi:hypothetical protein